MMKLSVACPTTIRPAIASIRLHAHAHAYALRQTRNVLLTTRCWKSLRLSWRAPNPQYRKRQFFTSAYSDSQPAAQQAENNKWADVLSFATSLYPVYVTAGGILAFTYPSAFSWFVSRGPLSYSLALATIMLAMGLSLSLEELFDVITKRPFQLLRQMLY